MYRLSLMIIVLSGSAYGQSYDHLEPDDSIFGPQWSAEYHSNVARVLGSVIPELSPKVFVLPSNINEYIIGISDEEGDCRIVFGRVEHTLWTYESVRDLPELREFMVNSNYPEDPLDVGVDVREQRASTEVCSRIRDVWATMLLRTRYPDPNLRRLGTDGVSFHFSTWIRGMGIVSGKIWSPERPSVPGRLVALSISMRDYAISGAGEDLAVLNEALSELERELD